MHDFTWRGLKRTDPGILQKRADPEESRDKVPQWGLGSLSRAQKLKKFN